MFLTCWNGARSRTAWVRVRLARVSSMTHHGSEGILGARASCPRLPHERGTPSWVRERLARVSSMTNHGTRGIMLSATPREQDARRGDWREAPGELGRSERGGTPLTRVGFFRKPLRAIFRFRHQDA